MEDDAECVSGTPENATCDVDVTAPQVQVFLVRGYLLSSSSRRTLSLAFWPGDLVHLLWRPTPISAGIEGIWNCSITLAMFSVLVRVLRHV